jgi:hypothetical protein
VSVQQPALVFLYVKSVSGVFLFDQLRGSHWPEKMLLGRFQVRPERSISLCPMCGRYVAWLQVLRFILRVILAILIFLLVGMGPQEENRRGNCKVFKVRHPRCVYQTAGYVRNSRHN